MVWSSLHLHWILPNPYRRDLRPEAYERAEEGADGSRVTVPLICGKTGHLSGVGGGVDAGTQSRGDAHGAVVNEREREE